jgi:cell division GTPase FtsZ
MRVLAIGLGGAGSRIVDKLYDHDQRSKVCCMSAVAIDIDANSLLQLRHIPDSARIFFPPVDPDRSHDVMRVIDIEEVMTRIQRLDTMEIDSILLCCGLGGNVLDVAPFIIKEIRKSYMEPIFALAVLPSLNDGKKTSAKAADDIDMLRDLVDAIILFDNETWSEKIRASMTADEKERAGIKAQMHRNSSLPGSNPRDLNDRINERIARQIGLLLRAGEFNEFGLEVAEVVLDAGEVLNTLKGNGFIAVGYAVEDLPVSWMDFLNRWRSSKYFMQGSHEKAARIVSLAKKAVYEEISVPCDLTSADKALVLIAGPSAELSMKGFQTVRKWIDRSIAGLEMRSGDYPVKNTAYVGIIIVLSGLSNIPRLEEIREIRTEYKLECEEEQLKAEEEARLREEEAAWKSQGPPEAIGDEGMYAASPMELDYLEMSKEMADISQSEKDEMITLSGGPSGSKKGKDDTIEIIPRASRRREDDAIILPPKQGGRAIDITGSTSVNSAVPAPKNTVFGPKEIHIDKSAPRDVEKGVDSASVKPVQRPKEGVMTGERISLNTGVQRASDRIFEESDVHVKEKVRSPKDDMLGSAGRGLDRGGRPKEVEPSRGKLRVIESPERPRKADKKKPNTEDDPDSDGFYWIT